MKPPASFHSDCCCRDAWYFSLQLGSEVQTEFFQSSVLLLQVHCIAGEVAGVKIEMSLGYVRGVDQGAVAGLSPSSWAKEATLDLEPDLSLSKKQMQAVVLP